MSTSFKIMIIDDNDQMAEMTKDYLSQRMENVQIEIFNSGEMAFGQQAFIPDAIILDYQLDTLNPGALNGMQVLLRLKKQFSVPVICLSAQEKPEVSANLIKAGAFDYVVKNQQAFNKMESIVTTIRNAAAKNTETQSSGISQKSIIYILIAIIALLVAYIIWR